MSFTPARPQTPLLPHGEEALQIAELGAILIIGAAVIFLVVAMAAIYALRSRKPA